MIADDKIGARGVKVKCKKCGNVIVVKPQSDATVVTAPPAADAGGAAGFGGVAGGMGSASGIGAGFGSAPGVASSAGAGSPFGAGGFGGAFAGGGFGGGASGFGAPAAGGFGAPAAGGFGAPAAGGFGSAPAAGGFGSAPAAGGFGGAPAAGAFGSAPAAGAFGGDLGAGAGAGAGSGAAGMSSTSGTAPSPDFGGGFNLGALSAAAAPQPAPSSRPAGEKEWYVAIDDAQVGPIDLAEIEQRWDGRGIDAETLAWKAGMGDWLPVAEIPEIAYLVTERPHAKPQAAPRAASSSSSGSSSGPAITGAGATALGPATFGGGGGEAGVDSGGWTPSAASALSSLVQEELTAAAAPKAAPQGMHGRSASGPDLGMPGFGAGDLFGGGSGGAGGMSAPAAQRGMDPFSAPSPAWSVPVTPRHSGTPKWIFALVGVFGVVLLGVVALLVVQTMRQPATGGATGPAPVVQTSAGGGSAGTQPSGGGASAGGGTESAGPSGGGERPRPMTKERPAIAKTKAAEPGGSRPAATPPPAAPAAAAKASLDKNDIFSGVKENARSVAPCLGAARSRNEVVPGAYTFTVNWTIKPDGSIANPRLTGPANVMSTSLPGCFASAMRGWRFPASQRETPIANFPLGPINIR